MASLKMAVFLQIPTLLSSQCFSSYLASMAKLFINHPIIPLPGMKDAAEPAS